MRRIIVGAILAALSMTGSAQSGFTGPSTSLVAWDAFLVIQRPVDAEGNVLWCSDRGAEVANGQCWVTGLIREQKGAAERVPAQVALERELAGKLSAGTRVHLVGVAPVFHGRYNATLATDRYVAFYKVLRAPQ